MSKTVGNRLRDFREAWGISKGQAAKMLLVSEEKYGLLESNAAIPDEAETAQIASLLGVTKEFLESGEYDVLKEKGQGHKHFYKTPKGYVCTEEFCGWRQNCGGGKFYCPGKGCMRELQEKLEGNKHAEH